MSWLSNLKARPKPVLNSATIGAAITFVVGVAVTFGIIPQATSQSVIDSSTTITGSIVTVFACVSTILAALHGSQKVTPVSDPQTNTGKELVPTPVTAAQDAHTLDPNNVTFDPPIASPPAA